MLKKYIGSKEFYKMVLLIAVPIMIQNGFTNLVNLLDNLMVGRIGTDEMSGVAIVNQLLFVYNLTVFGGLSGAGIFVSQFHGSGNKDGIRSVFKIKLVIGALLLALGLGVLILAPVQLISLFLHDGSQTGNLEATLAFARDYLAIMLVGLLPFTLNQCYASTLRETGETVAPMAAGIAAVLVNLVFNYLLIYGKLGCPRLGVKGAAIATVFSRFVECAILLIWTKRQSKVHTFASHIFRSEKIQPGLVSDVIRKGLPLLLNECLWSAGMTALNQCYSTRGLAVIAAVNICSTVVNVFNIVFIALGSSVSIVVGKLLGAGKMEEARDTDTKMIAFSVISSALIGIIMAAVSGLVPRLYNTTDEVKSLAATLILIMSFMMPVNAFNNASYFTLRSGGKTFITMLFDSVYVCVLCVPAAMLLANFTAVPIITLYICCQSFEFVKCIIGFFFVRSDKWMQNIVAESA